MRYDHVRALVEDYLKVKFTDAEWAKENRYHWKIFMYGDNYGIRFAAFRTIIRKAKQRLANKS